MKNYPRVENPSAETAVPSKNVGILPNKKNAIRKQLTNFVT